MIHNLFEGEDNTYTKRLPEYSIRVSNDTNVPPRESICYQDPGNTLLDSILQNDCKKKIKHNVIFSSPSVLVFNKHFKFPSLRKLMHTNCFLNKSMVSDIKQTNKQTNKQTKKQTHNSVVLLWCRFQLPNRIYYSADKKCQYFRVKQMRKAFANVLLIMFC